MLHTGPAFLNPSAGLAEAPAPCQNDTALLANTYVKAARAAERAGRWLLAQSFEDEARRLLEI
jgi:hypothetical protein